MGSCLGKCLPLADSDNSFRKFDVFPIPKNEVDFTHLIEESDSFPNQEKRNFLSRFLWCQKKNRNKKPVLELVDDLLTSDQMNYSRLNESQGLPSTGSCTSKDIQLQCLDARALLGRTNTPTPTNSLDLEWEHETLPVSTIHDPSGSSWNTFPEASSCMNEFSPGTETPACNSDSDWSRMSANSLEWDSVPNTFQGSPPVSDIDTDTQMLLSEIERLTDQTLRETGYPVMEGWKWTHEC